MREGMGQNSLQSSRVGFMEAGCEQRSGLVRSILGIGQIQQRELCARLLAQPPLQEGRDRGGRRRPRFHRHFVVRQCPGRKIRPGVRLANGDKQAWRLESQRRPVQFRGGDSGNISTRSGRVRDVELHWLPVDQRHRRAPGRGETQS